MPDIHVAPNTLDGLIKAAHAIKRAFDEAEAGRRDLHALGHLIAHPDALAAEARRHCLASLRDTGELHPRMTFFSRQDIQVLVFEGLPPDFQGQVGLTAALRVMVATSAVEAYWFACETWVAASSPDDAVTALPPREREDKRERLILVSATLSSYRVESFDLVRDSRGKPRDLLRVTRPARYWDAPVVANLFAGREETRARAHALMTKERP